MKVSFNRLDRGYRKYKKEYDRAAIATLESGWYILGENVSRFENEFARFIGSKYSVGLNSGLDALILAFRALGVGPGDEVIAPANTYIASILGISENGATPVLIEPDEFHNLDPARVEARITARTKAILVVHLYGQAADMAGLKALAERYGLYLVEDCAQSHGARYEGRMTGTWGDIGCFSFYPTKNIGAFGDGGAIVTESKGIYESIRMLRNYGSRVKYENEILGVNSRLDEMQAALLSVKLGYYRELRREREAIAARYLAQMNNEHIALPSIRRNSEHVWHLFVVRTPDRAGFQSYLNDWGIGTQVHYPIPPHLSGAYRYLGHKAGDFPITEAYADTVISLPLYEGMTKEEIDYVISAVNAYG